jgi:hypothetical protein
LPSPGLSSRGTCINAVSQSFDLRTCMCFFPEIWKKD